jgi:hypothetical protein
MEFDGDLLVALAPLIVLQLALMIAGLVDLARRRSVTGGNKLPWALLIVFVGALGPLIYFVLGRKDTA